MTNRPLRVFLCHSSNDKPAVRELYQKLRAEPWIQPWLDEEELYPGQDWNMEIEKAVEAADAIIVCLSKSSITKEGYVQRELRIVLDFADYKPEGTLYIMPVRLEECEPPRRLRVWQYADYFEGQRDRGLQRLLKSLKSRSDSLVLKLEEPETRSQMVQSEFLPHSTQEWIEANKLTLSNGVEFLRVPAGKFLMGSKNENNLAYDHEKPQHTVDIPYDYWMARFPVTNEMYDVYVKSTGIEKTISAWEEKKDHPVSYIKWANAIDYCQWLNNHLKSELPSGLIFRLPTEAEWEKTARGTDGFEYPWGNQFDKNKCNTSEGGKRAPTSVGFYSPSGDSPYGCADMSGNVWEWTHSLFERYPYKANDGREQEKASGRRVLRGGSFILNEGLARCASRFDDDLNPFCVSFGFRVVVSSALF